MNLPLLAMLLLMGSLGGCGDVGCGSPETDLRNTFGARAPKLERLVRMSEEDRHVIRIAPKFTRIENDWSWPRPAEKLGFPEARWNEYRELFAAVGATEGLDREPGAVLLTTKACGLGISGKSFGYAYLSTEPVQTLKKLDDQNTKGVGYMHLKDKWYMFVWAP